MKIAIPSYKRSVIFRTKTLSTLLSNEIKIEDIFLFVGNQDEYDIYSKELIDYPELKIIIGEVGMVHIRNFMTNYFEENEIIIYLDDDLEMIKPIETKTLTQVLDECIYYLSVSPYQLMGVPPTQNAFFNKRRGFITGLYVIVGCMYISKNDKSLKVHTACGEDHERTLSSYVKYGAVVRCCDLTVKTKPFSAGGLNAADGRTYESYYSALTKLYYSYPQLIRLTKKKIKYIHATEPVPHIKFKALKKLPDMPEIIQLPIVTKELFNELLLLINAQTLSNKQSYEAVKAKGNPTAARKGFPEHRADIYGLIKNRPYHGGNLTLSRVSIKKPKLYEELMRLGKILCPFDFTSVLINKNTICNKHVDANNIGKSMLVSIGDYTGCNIVIEGTEYDAHYQPIIFNGAKKEHWNTNDLVGDKYSLVYYSRA